MNTAILVATFQDYSSAKQAARELESLGISRDAVNVHSRLKTAGAGSVEHQRESESDSSFMGWWGNLFGSTQHENDRRAYESCLANGRAILRAQVFDALVDSAVSLLNRNGAISVEHDEQPNQDQTSGWTRAVPSGGVRVYQQNEPVVRTRRPVTGMSPTRPAPSVMSGFGATPGTGTLAGESTAGFTNQDFTPEYRRNFEQSYGPEPSFDAMRPAYEYGHRSADDLRYRGKSWTEVENDVRTEWERDNPALAWDRAREAVRYGWENVRRDRR